ncbi:Probable E3 ubiquitin-protein ligase ARI11 [Linum perenne]
MIVEANDGDATKASAGFSTIGKDDIERRLEGLIAEITSSLSVPRAPAVVLLVSNKWYSELIQENWFSDEEKMRRFLGLTMVASSSSAATEIYCKICWERISIPDFISLDCGHNFCNECWRQYIKVGVGDGIACLTLRCPEPKCYVLVPKSTVETLAESEDIEKYSRILRRSVSSDTCSIAGYDSDEEDIVISKDFEISASRLSSRTGLLFPGSDRISPYLHPTDIVISKDFEISASRLSSRTGLLFPGSKIGLLSSRLFGTSKCVTVHKGTYSSMSAKKND